MVITLSMYDTVFENAVYTQDFMLMVQENPLLTKRVIILRRYTEPTEDQVVAYLQKKVEALDGKGRLVLLDGSRLSEKGSALEAVLVALPDNVRNDIRTGNEDCITFIRDHTRAPKLKEGMPQRMYMHVKYGLLPSTLVEKNKEAGALEDAGWYDAALSHEGLQKAGFGEQFALKLAYDHRLPPQEEINVLLKHGTRISRTLEVSKTYSPREAQEVVNALYGDLSNSEGIALLRDVSHDILEEHSLAPLLALYQNVQEAMAKLATWRGNSQH